MAIPDCTEYRDILGFPGYRVGSDGTVWSRRDRASAGHGNGTVPALRDRWKLMKPSPKRTGHLQVALRKDGKTYYFAVHRLVLEAFVGPCPDGMECRHYPENDPANNKLQNLRWGTHLQNVRDKYEHGTMTAGQKAKNAILTDEIVLKLRALYDGGTASVQELAKTHDLYYSIVYQAVKRLSWKHL